MDDAFPQDPEIQKATGETDPVAVMNKLRELKNNFKWVPAIHHLPQEEKKGRKKKKKRKKGVLLHFRDGLAGARSSSLFVVLWFSLLIFVLWCFSLSPTPSPL